MRTVPTGEIHVYRARWFPDGRRLLVGGIISGREGRLYVLDESAKALRPITPEATGIGVLSPDGKWVATIGHDGHFLYPVDGGERRRFSGMERDEWPVQWSADGRTVYVRREGHMPLPVLRVDVQTGRKELWKELAPPDRAGVVWVDPLVTPDGGGYVYTYHRRLDDLYLVEGLK
jgi:Tol biopolymer transport system component